MSFKVLHIILLVLFAVAFVWAGRRIFEERNTHANAWMLPFAYFSLSAWIFCALQYLVLVAGPFGVVSIDSSRNIGLWLAVMENVLWATAILTLHSKQLSRVSLILPLLVMISILVALIIYKTTILMSAAFTYFGAVSIATIFLVLAVAIWQLRLSKLYVAYFFLHGHFQWFWKSLWFIPFIEFDAMLLVFPLWHIAIMFGWIRLISEMPVTFRVMISSTISDLVQEREAAERAIRRLKLEGLRSETVGSLPTTPRELCALWAEQCRIFILIIGERYGHKINPNGKSAVEFEYDVACKHDRGKILVYEKKGVTREPELEEFFERLKDFNRGHIISYFATPDDLYKQIQHDVPELVLRPKQSQRSVG
jgi:hypothetical protein